MIVVVVVAGIAAGATWLLREQHEENHLKMAAARLAQIREASIAYAGEHEGHYARHAGMLVVEELAPIAWFIDPRELPGGTFTLDGLDLGQPIDSIDLTERLRAAVDAEERTEGCYRFGDFWFAPIARPTGSGKIIFGWIEPTARGEYRVLFDDGHTESATGDLLRLFRADAAERERLDLEPVEPPEF